MEPGLKKSLQIKRLQESQKNWDLGDFVVKIGEFYGDLIEFS